MALITHFDAPVDPSRFLSAVDAVVARSDALRTTVRDLDGVPHPSVQVNPPSPCRVVRLDAHSLEHWLQEQIATPLDVARSAYESVLIDLGEDAWAWFVNVHHLVIDAASSAVFFRAVAGEYHGESAELGVYEQVWTDLVGASATARGTRASDFWSIQPDTVPTSLYETGRDPATAAERVSIDMASGRQDALDRFVGDPRFKLLNYELSQAVALALLTSSYLARLGNDIVTIGVPIHHRSTKASKQVIGPLVELFPLRVEIDREDTFVALHKKITRSFLELLSRALPGTSPRQSFDVVLNVHGATLGDFGEIGATTRWIHPGHIDPHHLLRVQALDYDGSGTLELALDINHSAASSGQRQRAARHVGRVFDAMVSDPERRVHSVALCDDDELLLLAPFTNPGSGTPVDGVIPEVLAGRLRSHAERATIQDTDGTVLTGADVDRRIEQVATKISNAGFGPGDLIGVEIGVSVDAVIAIHGIQRAGAAFVPIDPAYPEARREHIRSDSGCALVLRALGDLDELAPNAARERTAPAPDDVAYVIYTSGSTGLPKGVPITYRGLSEYLGFAYSAYIDQAAPTMPLFTSLSFDLTITTLYLPLLSGGVMTVHPDGGLVALREIVDQNTATLIKATPSHLELLVRMLATTEDSSRLTGLIVGGEAFMVDLAERILDASGGAPAIYNEYGPTEAVVGCMIHRYDGESDRGPEVPIGQPAPGVALHVLDHAGHPVPVGVVGELHIARPGMTSGYLRRPDLNTEKFAPVPTSGSDDILYRTGDVVRMTDANRMVYLGRADEQIKVGGIRLEPGEIEHLAQTVPGVRRAVARLWSPSAERVIEHCIRCGLPSDVPDVSIDGDGVCTSCHQFDLVAPQAEAWFRTEADLAEAIAAARQQSSGDYDVIHLISGGKDSTYALYKLVELGARVFAITLDNGFIADVAKANVRRATDALGVDHEFVTIDGMNEIFKDSLERFSNVCQGCYKAIYTIALAKAEELGVSAIVTGLSRGQFFETRLVPAMFGEERFDPEAIDAMVREARHVYHTVPDAVSEHMDVEFLADGEIFDRISFIDFYRYVDVPLSEMYEALEASNTWQRPPDSGRSTNCLINSAGIFVHKIEQGHHNYAAPYSWDVRLGHKTRDEALFELDDPMDDEEIAAITSMLAAVGYEPSKPEMLTLWVEAGEDLDLDALRSALDDGLPAHGLPRAIEVIDQIPLTTNGKVDVARLPDPALWRSAPASGGRDVSAGTEADVAAIWSSVLGVAAVGATDDFFALGGTSLHALEMIVRVSDHFDVLIPESLAFTKRTVVDLARHIDESLAEIERTDSGSADVRSGLTISTLDASEPLPLSAGEEAMLYEWRRDPTDRRYNVARLYRLDASVDRERLDDAIRQVVAHHPTLRTSYGLARTPLNVDAALYIGQASSERSSLTRLADQLNSRTFDLVHGPLITVHHLTSSHPADAGIHGLLIRSHHIVTDAGSLDVLWEQIDRCYRGDDLPDLEATYAEHAVWQSGRVPDASDVWSPIDPPAELQIRAATSGATGVEDGYVHQRCAVTAEALRNAPAPTLFANALAALTAAVRPFHDGSNIEITITSSVRDHPAISDVVGYFLNPLPLVLQAERSATLRELAASTGETLAKALEHRAVPFGAVVASARERGIAPPTGRIMLAVEDLAPAELDGEPVEHEILSSGVAVNDLTFFVQIRGDLIELGCEYRGSTIGKDNAERLLAAFAQAIEQLVEQPGCSVESLAPAVEMLSGGLLEGQPLPVHELILRSIETAPDEVAVTSGDVSLTYAELDKRGREIAARLRGVGVERGDRIAIALVRSVDLVPAIWAAWMLGASYVPIDISQPATRMTALLSAAGVRAAVSSGAGHPGLGEVRTVLVDRADAAVLPVLRPTWADPNDEAYVIFTSGSTGRPKGVSISHGNLAVSMAARKQFYPAPVHSFLLVSSAGFDSSVAGLFWTLVDAGKLVIPTESEAHDVDALGALVQAHQVSHTLMVPSLYAAMLQRDSSSLLALSTVIVAGEPCPPALVRQHFDELASVELVNEYGPTEATVWATAHRCVPHDAHVGVVPIGELIAGMNAEVVDAAGVAVPANVAGELWLTGPSVSAGYLDDAGAAPVDHGSFVEGRHEDRTYRTGDLVVYRANGVIEFLGRVDDQLSAGGVRIEPSEIERVFTTLAGVDTCLVSVLGRDLVAGIEVDGAVASEVDPNALRASALRALPSTHVPKHVRIVDSLPRNANGKLDRAAFAESLAELVAAPVDNSITASRVSGDPNPMVARVVEIFSAAFDGAVVHPTSDFFDLGGDSLRAVAVVSMLENEFGRRVAIGELVDAPTPLALVAGKLGEPHSTSGSDQSATQANGRSDQSGEHDLVEWLRRSGSKRPLVVLPPGGGNLLRYAPLVQSLDAEVPVVGVRLPGADARSEIVDTIEEQAAAMLAALDSAVSDGPYRLLGWSTGGLIAWEMARLLAERGDVVEGIVLVDTVMAGLSVDDTGTITQKYQEMLRTDGVLAVASEGAGRLVERASFALARRRYRHAREAGQTPSLNDAERQLGPVIRRAAAGYTPAPQDVRVIYVSASESDPDVTVNLWRALHGHSGNADSRFVIVSIDGVHFLPEDRCIIGKEKAPELVERLGEYLHF